MGRRRQRLHRSRLAAKKQATTTNPTVGIENSVAKEMLVETTATPVTETTATTPVEIEETTPVLESITTPTKKKATRKTTNTKARKKKTPTRLVARKNTKTNSSK